MSEEEIIERAKQVVRIEAKVVKDLESRINNEFKDAVMKIYKSKGRVVFTGMGKSGLIARKIVATLNSTGTASIYMHPTDALHGDLGMVRKEDIVIIISKSGSTEELINLLTMLRRLGVTIIGMVGADNTQINKFCNYIIDISVEEEACPNNLAPTSSTTASLVMGDAIAVSLLQLKNFTAKDFASLHPGGSLGKRLSLRIEEIMFSGDDLPVVKYNTTMMDTIFEITSKRLGTSCVVDDNGDLIGIITDGDLRRGLEKDLDIKSLIAEDLMSPDPKTIQKELLASFAIQEMERFKITTLIVVDGLKPVGIVHLHELVKLGLQRR